jgi:hypothetical protein
VKIQKIFTGRRSAGTKGPGYKVVATDIFKGKKVLNI